MNTNDENDKEVTNHKFEYKEGTNKRYDAKKNH